VWQYKVISGQYELAGGDVVVENESGRSPLQKALDFYGEHGYEMCASSFDAINRELIVVLKKQQGAPAVTAAVPPPRAGAAAPLGAAGSGGGAIGAGDEPPARRAAAPAPGATGRRRRSKAELDRLYRDT